MAVVKVFNAVGSSEEKYQQFLDVSNETGNKKIMHPLEWWKNRRALSQNAKLRCANHSCDNPAEVGAHVIDEETGNHVYILPTCKACNNKEDESYFVDDSHLEECTNIPPQRELIQKSKQRFKTIKGKADWFKTFSKLFK